MIPVPRIPRVEPNQKLGFGLVNHIIKRTEYAAELLRQYKCVAGDDMFVEPHPDGTRISYLQGVGGGVRKTLLPYPYPPDLTPPTGPSGGRPTEYDCGSAIAWDFSVGVGPESGCTETGPPCPGPGATCVGGKLNGYVVAQGIFNNSCLAGKLPYCSFAATYDDFGYIGTSQCPFIGGCGLCFHTGITPALYGSYDNNYFFLYVPFYAENGPQGGPYGFSGSGTFFLA